MAGWVSKVEAGGTLHEMACLTHLSAVGGCTRSRREDQCAAPVTHPGDRSPRSRPRARASSRREPLPALGGDQGLLGEGQRGRGAAPNATAAS